MNKIVKCTDCDKLMIHVSAKEILHYLVKNKNYVIRDEYWYMDRFFCSECETELIVNMYDYPISLILEEEHPEITRNVDHKYELINQ